jgi:small-conductance mechanosensitive channel
VISNVIAGYTMTYRKAFKVGDRVRVGEHIGDVHEVRVLTTHLRTPKNEIVAIPNSLLLGGEVLNYSKLASKSGLILHTTVGIGYETPWPQVAAVLQEAPARTPGLLRQPSPFVLQRKLGDFCVDYEINGYCSDAHAMYRVYTDLHRNILDVFNEYGIQIMTPAYEGDPADPKVVPREQWYLAPAQPPAAADDASSAGAHRHEDGR